MDRNKSGGTIEEDEVAHIYDRFTALSAWDGNLHFGYWDDIASDTPIEKAANRLTDIMAEKLSIGADSHILDIGCGVGGPAMRISRNTGARVTGISISPEQVKLANAAASSAGLSDRVAFQCQNAMKLEFPESSFDAAIAIESIMNMSDRDAVMSRVAKTLRPGGRLVLTDAFKRGPIPPEKQPAVDRFFDGFKCSMVQAEEYPSLLRRAGLQFDEIVDITDHTMFKSWSILSKRFTELLPQLNEAYGKDMAQVFDTTDLLDIPQLGYLLVVARRLAPS